MIMTRRTTLAFVNLSLCALLAFAGCKSSNSLGLADKSTPGASEQTTRAANSSPALAKVPPTESERAVADQPKPEGFSLARTFKSATSWLPLKKSDDEAERTLDRELTLRQVPSSAGRFGPTPSGAAPGSDSPANPAKYTPGDWRTGASSRTDARSTPSLVRHSRRPPPDPAPKPPQENLLAQKTFTRNPYAHASSQLGSLSRTIATASRAWQADMAKAKALAAKTPATNVAATETPAAKTLAARTAGEPIAGNSDLKFVAPKIGQKAQDQKTTDVAQGRAPTGDKDPSQKPATQPTIPRRSDLLAQMRKSTTTESQKSTDSHKPDNSGDKPKTTVADTEWIAKKSATSAKSSPAPDTPAIAANRPDHRSVVADTFAAKPQVAGQVAQANPENPARPQSEQSAFPLSKPLANVPTSPQYITNPHASRPQRAPDVDRNNAVAQATAGPSSNPAAVAASESPQSRPMSARPGVPEQQPPQLAQSAVPAQSQTAHTTQLAHPAQSWRKPVPFAPSGQNSYQAYYQRGIVPQAQATSRPIHPQPSQQPIAVGVPSTPAMMQMPEQMAPLVDAETYRLQQNHLVMPATTQQPAPRGTWLAAYQKLIRGDRGSQSGSAAAPGTGATRSLHSGR